MNDEVRDLIHRSINHVRAQGRPSVDPTLVLDNTINQFRCAYRSSEGLMCAAGMFILEYDPRMEGHSWPFLLENFPHCLDPAALGQSEIVATLQACHDQAYLDSISRKVPFLQCYEAHVANQIDPRYVPPKEETA
jgi:hypothetical protein